MKRFCCALVFRIAVALGFARGGLPVAAQHVHLFCGAPSPGAALFFVNGTQYDTNSNGGITPECFFMNNNDPLYPDLYQSDATFAALPATICAGGPAPNAAALGAYIEARFVSVSGPAGGEISLWQEPDDASYTTKLFSVPVGTYNGTNRINVSEGIAFTPFPDCQIDYSGGNLQDPFGHVHGRRFTANKVGLYVVGFQLIDTSTNAPNHGPIHPPSKTNYFYFQAGLFIDWITRTSNVITVHFGARPFNNYDLEVNTNLALTNWSRLETYTGNTHSHIPFLTDTNATTPARFYRVRELH